MSTHLLIFVWTLRDLIGLVFWGLVILIAGSAYILELIANRKKRRK